MMRFRCAVSIAILSCVVAVQSGFAIEPPPGIPAVLLKPREGDALDKARLPLKRIIDSIERPDYMPRTRAAAASEAKRVDDRIAELKQALKKDPANRKATTELVDLLVVAKDAPADAVPFAGESDNFLARKYVPLIAQDISKLEDTQLWDIANWYVRLAVSAKGKARVRMNERSVQFYEAYLKAHPTADVDRASVIDALAKVKSRLVQLKKEDKDKSNEPSFAVQRHYTVARNAWREGRPHEAIQRLRLANNLAPNQPHLLRLLGRIYFTDVRNAEQGAYYLKQAVRAEPADLESIFLLGRYEFLSLRKWDNAITIMAYAQSLPDDGVDEAIPVLATHYLARALEREGYDHAAIEQYEEFLSQPINAGAGSRRFFQEISLFARTRPVSWQQVGDAYNRLGEPGKAIEAYEKAASLQGTIELSVAGRLVYSYLLEGNQNDATELVLEAIQSTNGRQSSLTMLQYLIDRGVKVETLAKQLLKVYEDLERPASIALALAELRGGKAGIKVLSDHLAAKPGDGEVFSRLLEMHTLREPNADLVAAIRTTAALITKLPAASTRYAEMLINETGKPADVAKTIAGLDVKDPNAGALALIKAMAFEAADQPDAAIAAYREAVKINPTSPSPRLGLAKLLIGQKQFDEADKVLTAAPADGAEAILSLRVQILRETKQLDAAMKLLDKLMQNGKSTASLFVEKYKLQVEQMDVAGAVKTLENGIDAHPNSVQLFEALFDLYDEHMLPDADREVARLTARAIRQIPLSAIARSKQAEQLMRARDFESAEKLLRATLDDFATDRRSMELLLFVLTISDRQAAANQFIDQKIKQFPRNLDVLESAIIHYRRTNNQNKLYLVLENYVKVTLTGNDQTFELARLYIQSDRPAQAIEILTTALGKPQGVDEPVDFIRLLSAAMFRAELPEEQVEAHFKTNAKLYPDHDADITFEWAMYLERLGKKKKSESLLEKVIAKDPNHARANNALGYSWVDQGINLQKAEKMIALALKEDPKSSAYLDSMGWAKYKLGEFKEAVKWLEKSSVEEGGDHSVILDHLGDAYYRAGRQVDAFQTWLKAQGNLDPEDAKVDAEIKALIGKLEQKIGAVRTAKNPELADSPGLKKSD